MKVDRWQEIDALFEAALEKTGAARQDFLAGLDPDLRSELDNLLAADQAARTFLERSTWLATAKGDESDGSGDPRLPEVDLPKRIGPYKVLGMLGEGGMGRVLLASRADEQFERLVAIKTLRARLPGPLRDELLARFDLERQALAQLEHPNIARLYDAGRDAAGDPYLVLEHVDGMPIDLYCDEHRLDTASRLRLFAEVCQAVQVAHRNLLVHRDLKPSNILVTREGRPMLLDFGIAKLLDPARIAGEVLETRAGSRPMTPGYASPEQVKGEPITTASDVYSLGVLLYELLTGRKPYRVTSWLPHELERAICEVEPERPSTAVFRAAGSKDTRDGFDAPLPPDEVAARRSTSPTALARLLRGDLDTLLQTALRKDPDQRYASVEALVQDIEAFLGGLPLAARPASTLYTLRKFVRRHRLGVAAASTLAALLLVFLVVLANQARQIRAERDKAQQALAFLIEVFKASDPSRAQGEELKAREILDGAARRIEKELAAQPEIQATLMDAMGQVYLGLGLYQDADTLFAKSLERRRQELGPDDPATLAVERSLAWARLELGDLNQAKSLFEDVVTRLEQNGGHAPDLADARLGFGDCLHGLGDPDAAIAQKEKALQGLEKEAGLEAEKASAELSLGISLTSLSPTDRARQLYARAEARRRRIFGDHSLEVADVIFRRGELERLAARYSEAIPLFDQALAVQRKLLDPAHPNLLASLQNQAICMAYVGEASQAIPLYQEVYEKQKKRLGPRHPEVANTATMLSTAYALKGDLTTALAFETEALSIRREVFGPLHSLVADALCEYADLLRELGRYEEAARECQGAIAVQKQLDRPEIQVGRGLICLGKVEYSRQNYAAAADILRPVYEERKARLPPGAEAMVNAEVVYGCALARLGRFAEADPILRSGYNGLVGRNPHSMRAGLALECLLPTARGLGRADADQIDSFLAHSNLRGPLAE